MCTAFIERWGMRGEMVLALCELVAEDHVHLLVKISLHNAWSINDNILCRMTQVSKRI